MTSLSHSVFAIADLVIYRGQPVENDIFTHPTPELPEETDLLDRCLPYIHYIYPMRDHMDEVLRVGSTRKLYFADCKTAKNTLDAMLVTDRTEQSARIEELLGNTLMEVTDGPQDCAGRCRSRTFGPRPGGSVLWQTD